MQRRHFLQDLTAAGLLSMFDPTYLAAKEALQAGQPTTPVPRRRFGRANDQLSIIGFGGIVVQDTPAADAANYVAEAVARGVNYFDVAPTYGNAQERLGPALRPHREQCFLACKTTQRDAAGARTELEASLKSLHTDRLDLYQLHALTTPEDVQQAFGPGGAMETFVAAREAGQVRYLGFSAHSEAAALAALAQFDFDSVLFPLSFPIWIQGHFGPAVHAQAKQHHRAVLALKAMAHQKWPESADKRWDKTWYEPFDTLDKVALGLRFTLHLPVDAMIPPGHWELFEMAVGLAQSGALTPLNDEELQLVTTIAHESNPVFTA